jgi:hypothetical protein
VTTYPDPTTPSTVHRTSPALIALAWLVVSLPAAWGVYQTARKAAALFTPPHATAQATTAPISR